MELKCGALSPSGTGAGGWPCDKDAGHTGNHRAYFETIDEPIFWRTPDAVDRLARCVVDRVLSVYREDYIDRMDRDEPESLLGLVKRLERALAAAAVDPQGESTPAGPRATAT